MHRAEITIRIIFLKYSDSEIALCILHNLHINLNEKIIETIAVANAKPLTPKKYGNVKLRIIVVHIAIDELFAGVFVSCRE